MEALVRIDWQQLLVPQFSVFEMLLRGCLIYLSLVLLLRIVLKRQAGRIAMSDLVVVTLVTGVCRNPLIADRYSLTDSLGVVAVVLGCSYAVDWLSYHSQFIHGLVHSEPVLLVQDGEVNQSNLKQELMTEQRLRSKLRAHGIRDLNQVAQAWLEADGTVSVLKEVVCPHCHDTISNT